MVLDGVTIGILVILLVMDGVLLLVYWWADRRPEIDNRARRRFKRVYLLGSGLVNAGALFLLVGLRTLFLPTVNPDSPFAALAPLPFQDTGGVALLLGYVVIVAALAMLGRAASRAE